VLLDCRLILSPICRPLCSWLGSAVVCSAALAEAARSEALQAQSDMQVASCATMPSGLGSPARLLAQALTEAWAQQEHADSSERSMFSPTRVRPSDEARCDELTVTTNRPLAAGRSHPFCDGGRCAADCLRCAADCLRCEH
jgi:hypothetical protein